MKHILFVLDYYTPHRGGAETVFENIISRLLSKGYKVSVLTSHYDEKLPEIEIHQALHIYRTGGSRIKFMWSAIWQGIKILKKHKDIKVIHASTYGGAIPASILGIVSGKRVVLTVHEIFGKLWALYKGKLGGRLYRRFEDLIFCLPYDIYHCVSHYTHNSLRVYYGLLDDKMKMIHNGVDTDFRDPTKVSDEAKKKLREENGRENKFVLLYYGHAGKSKGIDYLIDAIPEIIKNNPDIVLVFNLIHSNRTNQIKKIMLNVKCGMLNKEEAERVFIFNGFEQEELRRLVASVDAVIAPSISEGFGSVHTEVCAMKKPLITTNVASIPEVVRGNVIFINPCSAQEIINGLADCRLKIKDTKNMLPQKIFSWDETVSQIERLYGN